jgi:hypothetical protein
LATQILVVNKGLGLNLKGKHATIFKFFFVKEGKCNKNAGHLGIM